MAKIDQPHKNFYVRIDPDWTAAHPGLWKHPIGNTLPVTYASFFESGLDMGGGEPNYARIDPVGRNEGYVVYSNTTNRELPITFTFQVQGGAGLSSGITDFTSGSGSSASIAAAIKAEVLDPVSFLEALKYGITDTVSGISYPPPTVIVKVGNLTMVRAKVLSAQPKYLTPIEPETMLPYAAEVACTFVVVRRKQKALNYQFNNTWQ